MEVLALARGAEWLLQLMASLRSGGISSTLKVYSNGWNFTTMGVQRMMAVARAWAQASMTSETEVVRGSRFCTARKTAGTPMVETVQIIATTISSSIRVNPDRSVNGFLCGRRRIFFYRLMLDVRENIADKMPSRMKPTNNAITMMSIGSIMLVMTRKAP